MFRKVITVVSSFISQILTAQCTFATLTSTLFLSSTIGGASVIFSEAESFFADSRSYSMATPSQPRLGGTQTREMQFHVCTEHS